MKIETLQYKKGSGWSAKEFPKLDSKNTVLFLFGSSDIFADQQIFSELQSAFPLANKIGCSSSGEIFGNRIFDQTLSVAVAKFEKAETRVFSCPIAHASESFAVGQILAKGLADAGLKAVFLLSDGLRVNGSELLRGVNCVLDQGVVVTGGLAGDGWQFKRNWVIHEGKPSSGFVSALGFYGNTVHVGHGSQGGWDIFGPERIITKSEGNILFELDGRPALDLYKEYLGENAAGLPGTSVMFPFQIRAGRDAPSRMVRTIVGINELNQSMSFAGDVPKGYLAQLMRANSDRLIDGASRAAEEISLKKMKKSEEVLSIAISSVGRRRVLGDRAEEEVDSILENLPPTTKQIGFYSSGEISPLVGGKICELHNQSIAITTIFEDEAA